MNLARLLNKMCVLFIRMETKKGQNFVLIGAAGYIAPRHMKAISDVGGRLLVAYDPFDSVGILDSYFPDADFFTEFERFDRHIENLLDNGIKIDYVSICSPNYLHDSHIRFGLRIGADVICEKPIVLNPWNIDRLIRLEKKYNKKIYTILQLRLHEKIIALKNKIDVMTISTDNKINVKLEYYTSRGKWYNHSWKGNIAKSGGIATNIGVHFFDMLIWIFGAVQENHVISHKDDFAEGRLVLEKAIVDWKLSTNYENLPEEVKVSGKRTYRSLNINNKSVEFSTGFTELHTNSYQNVIDGIGFRISETKDVIQLVSEIRNTC